MNDTTGEPQATGASKPATSGEPVVVPDAGSPELGDKERKHLRVAGAALAAALAASLFYAVDRTYQAITSDPFDPLAVIASVRIDYFWRITLSAYVAIMVAGAWMWGMRGREEAGMRWAMRALWVVIPLCCLLSVLWP